MMLPPQGQAPNITCLAVTRHFIVTSSKLGVIAYYLAKDCSPVNEFRHEEGAVVRIFPQPEGSRMVFEDDKGHLFVFNPVNDQVGGPWGGGGRSGRPCSKMMVQLHKSITLPDPSPSSPPLPSPPSDPAGA